MSISLRETHGASPNGVYIRLTEVCYLSVYYVFLFTQQTIQDSISPVWEEPFRFLIHDPKYQELDIEVSWIFVSFSCDYC